MNQWEKSGHLLKLDIGRHSMLISCFSRVIYYFRVSYYFCYCRLQYSWNDKFVYKTSASVQLLSYDDLWRKHIVFIDKSSVPVFFWNSDWLIQYANIYFYFEVFINKSIWWSSPEHFINETFEIQFLLTLVGAPLNACEIIAVWKRWFLRDSCSFQWKNSHIIKRWF